VRKEEKNLAMHMAGQNGPGVNEVLLKYTGINNCLLYVIRVETDAGKGET
jgi:hypothetical protein